MGAVMPVRSEDCDRLEELVARAGKRLVLLADGGGDETLAERYAVLRGLYQGLTDVMLKAQRPLLDVRVLLAPQFCTSAGDCERIGCRPRLATELSQYSFGQFRVVALGGTFDRLHAGHKLMLSVSAMLARDLVVCGITGTRAEQRFYCIDDNGMLAQKQFKDRIESFQARSTAVREFFESFAPPTVRLEIVKLDDAYGPTITEPAIDALVVSPETLAGGQAINRIRRERGMAEMEIVSVDLIAIDVPSITDRKLSSTLLRSYM